MPDNLNFYWSKGDPLGLKRLKGLCHIFHTLLEIEKKDILVALIPNAGQLNPWLWLPW